MPLLVQVYAAIYVSPESSQFAVNCAEAHQPFRRDIIGESKRQLFQSGKYGAGLAHLVCIQGSYTEAAPHIGIEHALACQPEQRLSNRRSAHPQLARQIGIADPEP